MENWQESSYKGFVLQLLEHILQILSALLHKANFSLEEKF